MERTPKKKKMDWIQFKKKKNLNLFFKKFMNSPLHVVVQRIRKDSQTQNFSTQSQQQTYETDVHIDELFSCGIMPKAVGIIRTRVCARLSQRHITLGKCFSKCATNVVRGFSAWLKMNRSNLYLGALREQHRCEFSGTQHTFLFFSFNSQETYRACDLCCAVFTPGCSHNKLITSSSGN